MKKFMECKVLIIMAFLPALVLSGCSKEIGHQGTEGPEQGEEQPEEAPQVGKLYVELNGEVYCAISGEGGPDTIRLQEEGLRTLRIIGWEPEGAASVKVDSVSFHHNIYSFNYTGDSIVILGGRYALPCNHYICNVGEGLKGWQGRGVSEAGEAKFYNYTASEYDYVTIEEDGESKNLPWTHFGKYRSFKIKVFLEQEGDRVFEIPFYELPNSVEILPGGSIPEDGVIAIGASPGDTVQLAFAASTPDDFNVFEWGMGVATGRFNPLNADAVEGDYFEAMGNAAITEEGMRYTASKVHLSREGVLTVDADWDPEQAKSSGGKIFDQVPVFVIGMPAGNPIVESLARSFTFPQGERRDMLPTPFFCNALVKIHPKPNGQDLQFAGKKVICSK